MKPIFIKNYKIFKILIILILAILISMLTVFGDLSENRNATVNTLSIAEEKTTEPSEKNTTAITAFKEAVSKLPDDMNKLEYNHKSLLEDAKKKYNALSEDDGVNHKETLNNAGKRYAALTEYVFLANEEDEDARHKEIFEDAKKRYGTLSEKEVLTEKEDQELMLSAEIIYKTIHKEFSSDFMMIESLVTLGKGLLGIFIVMGIIIVVIYLLNRAGKDKNNLIEKV